MCVRAHVAVLIMILFQVAVVAPAQTPPKGPQKATGSIAGRVTIGDKGVPNVVLALLPTNYPYEWVVITQTKTDWDGHFRLTGVAAGSYYVGLLAPALIVLKQTEARQPGKAVTISDGEAVEGVDFSLTRGGVIAGRLTDADGQPVVAEPVVLMQVDERGQRRQFSLPTPFRFETDDRGVYRLYGVPAGRYLVGAGVIGQSGGVARQGAYVNFYQRTYHPDATDEAKAKVIEVTAGGEVTNVDIKFGRSVKLYTASGRVVEAVSGRPVPGLHYAYGALMDNGKKIGNFSQPLGPTNAQGEFQLEGLIPGQYAVYLMPQGDSDWSSNPVNFEVKNSQVTGLEIKVRYGASISGQVAVEGTNDPAVRASLSQIQVYASVPSPESLSRPVISPVKVAVDGSFRIAGLREGVARLYPIDLPKGLALLRIERDGVAERDGIKLAAGAQVTGVRLVLGYGTGVLRGQVKIEGGVLPEGSHLLVYAQQASTGLNVQTVEADARGQFRIESLVTGNYELTLEARPPYSPGSPPSLLLRVRQTAAVTNGAETEVIFTLDVSRVEKEKNQ